MIANGEETRREEVSPLGEINSVSFPKELDLAPSKSCRLTTDGFAAVQLRHKRKLSPNEEELHG